MPTVTIVNGTIVLPDRLLVDHVVETQRGRITAVQRRGRHATSGTIIDAHGGYVCPGFIDLHVHGGGGADFMDGTPDAVRTACAAHLRHGTTTIVPTTTTGTPEQIRAMLAACREVRESRDKDLPSIPGIHLYGPYFAPDKVGCHSTTGRRDPQADEYRDLLESGQVIVATCAAELPGAEAFFQVAHTHCRLLTCGHSNASWSEMQIAFNAGMRHVDHFWCAMSSVPSLRQRFGVPMQASMAEFVLMTRDMSTEVIADGCHLSNELLEFAWRMLGPRRLLLVTDCNRALDCPPGRYRFGCEADGTWFDSDGDVGRAPNGSLASSVKGVDHMVRTMSRATTAELPDVIRMASLTPAERIGIHSQVGSIETGKRADLVILASDLTVRKVIRAGRVVV